MSFLFKKKNKKTEFKIDYPKLSIVPHTSSVIASLKSSNTEYHLVANGYIVFEGKAFNSDLPLMFGIHYNSLRVEFIEIFRPREYYETDYYDINESFNELSGILRRQYGRPTVTTAAFIGNYPCEQWITPNYIVNHYIFNRFGPEEHLHINFFKE